MTCQVLLFFPNVFMCTFSLPSHAANLGHSSRALNWPPQGYAPCLSILFSKFNEIVFSQLNPSHQCPLRNYQITGRTIQSFQSNRSRSHTVAGSFLPVCRGPLLEYFWYLPNTSLNFSVLQNQSSSTVFMKIGCDHYGLLSSWSLHWISRVLCQIVLQVMMYFGIF